MESSLPAPGWYTDPADPTRKRWWDGAAWEADSHPREDDVSLTQELLAVPPDSGQPDTVQRDTGHSAAGESGSGRPYPTQWDSVPDEMGQRDTGYPGAGAAGQRDTAVLRVPPGSGPVVAATPVPQRRRHRRAIGWARFVGAMLTVLGILVLVAGVAEAVYLVVAVSTSIPRVDALWVPETRNLAYQWAATSLLTGIIGGFVLMGLAALIRMTAITAEAVTASPGPPPAAQPGRGSPSW